MKIVSAIALGILASSVTVAQAKGDVSLFDKLDVNKDGAISTSEAEADMRVLERFNQLDTNGRTNHFVRPVSWRERAKSAPFFAQFNAVDRPESSASLGDTAIKRQGN